MSHVSRVGSQEAVHNTFPSMINTRLQSFLCYPHLLYDGILCKHSVPSILCFILHKTVVHHKAAKLFITLSLQMRTYNL